MPISFPNSQCQGAFVTLICLQEEPQPCTDPLLTYSAACPASEVPRGRFHLLRSVYNLPLQLFCLSFHIFRFKKNLQCSVLTWSEISCTICPLHLQRYYKYLLDLGKGSFSISFPFLGICGFRLLSFSQDFSLRRKH